MGIRFEEITTKDFEKLSAFQPEGWNNIIPRFEQYIQFDFCHPVKMCDDNEIYGVAAAILYENTGWIAHVIINEKFRTKGFGAKILDYLCNYCKSKNCETILLFTTDMGYPLYKKYGFIDHATFVQYEKTAEIAYSPNSNIRKSEPTDHQKIFELDKMAAGEDRRNVLTPHLNSAYVYSRNDEVTGFYMKELFEGLIIAGDEESGLELIKLRSSHNTKATLPIENTAGNNYFKENNFKEIAKLVKMIYGNDVKFNGKYIYNRIGGSYG
ncbi:MAG: GNAT family N-acetyltransferase [Treponema sp.]|nr:GNAT family N-acetyltransferase [Treponema sp.]